MKNEVVLMKNYMIKKINTGQLYLINMDCDSILNYLAEVENEDTVRTGEGELIIDQLLVTGNSSNRFLSCGYAYGRVLFGSAKNVEGSYELRKITSDLFRKQFKDIECSVLSHNQLEMIREGRVL